MSYINEINVNALRSEFDTIIEFNKEILIKKQYIKEELENLKQTYNTLHRPERKMRQTFYKK